MRSKLFVVISVSILFLSLTVYAEIPAGYYDTATGSGYSLKTQLHNIIDDHTSVSYTPGVWNAFTTIEIDNYYENDGSPLDVYSEDPNSIDPYNWSMVADQCGSYTGEGSCYNREHSFPKSWFNDAAPMYTDIHHLYLTDGYVNGKRSNWPFGEVGSATWTSLNGSKVGSCDYPGYSGTVFEPIDEFKGDFARTYFYMATRYEDIISGWSSTVLDGSSDKVYVDWHLNMLMEWHVNDPVSQKEIDRNNGVYTIQNNRNPFIDHPEYAAIIWQGAAPVPSINFVTTSQQIEENVGTLTLNLSISEAITEDVTANLTITGNAIDPDDYTVSTTSVLFPGSSIGNQSTVVTIVDDMTPEDFETIILTIDNLTTSNPDIVIGSSDQITITINNSDGFDETPPTILSHTIVDSTTLVLSYSEDIDPLTSQSVTNYVVDNGLGNPVAAVLGYLGDSTKVVLTFTLIQEDISYQLTINNVEDLASNPIAADTTVDFIISTSGSEGWIEYFEDATFASYFTGTVTYPTGDWDLLSVYLEPISEAYEGDHAVRMDDDTANASITTPVVNGIDSVIFYYRALNQEGSASTFWLQKSVDGGAFSNVTSQTFQNNTYAQFAYKVNDASDNILLRVLNDNQAGHLIVDYFKVVTFSGPVGDTTPPTILSHEIANGSDIILDFDELLDPTTAQLATNYVLDNAVGNPSTAVLGYLGDFTKVVLSFAPFVEDVNYQLTINNVEDSAGNPMTTDTVDFIINSGGTVGGEGWIEYFEDASFASYYTGTVTYPTGDWDLVEVYLEPVGESYEGVHAVRLNDSPDNSSLTTPAVNGIDSVIFYHRALNGGDPSSTFVLQKSVNGGAFEFVTSQSYSGSVYIQFAFKVNDPSDNIKLRVINDGSAAHLIIDNFEVVTFPVANDPDAPANVTTTISGSDLVIDWDVSANATGYDVYSSDDPYGTFNLVTTVGTNQYTVPADQAKLFYYIIAK